MGKAKKKQHKSSFDYLAPLAAIVVILMVMFAIVLTTASNQKVLSETTVQYEGPVLKNGATQPEVTAKAAYAEDVETGKPLYYKNGDEPMLPASTTKIATALVALQTYDLENVATVSGMKSVFGQKMGLMDGENITFKNLLYGLLVYSGNDAAEVLARNYPGGRDKFIEAMNQLVSTVGLTKTHFVNPSGIDAYLHFSTARDLAKLAEYGEQNPNFAEFTRTQKVDVTSLDGNIIHRLESTNKLLGKVDGVIGVKTGTTLNSGESLITMVDRNHHRVVITILDSKDRFVDTEKLIDWIFESYSWEVQK